MKTDCAAVKTLLSWFPPTMTPRGDGSYIVAPPKLATMMTVKDVAKAMHVHPSSVYRRIWEKDLPCSRPLKRRILIPAEAVQAWIAESIGPEYRGRN